MSIQATPVTWGDPTNMFAVSQQLIAVAGNYVGSLAAAAGQLQPPVINPSFPKVADAPKAASETAPDVVRVDWVSPEAPVAFDGTSDLVPIEKLFALLPADVVNPLDAPPDLNFGSAPTSSLGGLPAAPATDLSFSYPDVAITLPPAPKLLTLDTVAFPNIVIPGFDINVPAMTAVAPGEFHYVEGAMFTSALLTQLQTNLQAALTNGSYTMMTTAAQQALWDAAREREYRQQADALAELERMETLGYAFPPGVFIDARIKMQTETNNTIAGLSRDIMAKQAELQLENIVKARETAVSLEGKLIDYANEVAQRTFDAAKYAIEAGVEIYNAKVKAYEVSLESFRTQAQIYDTQIKALLSKVEVAKAQIAFEQAKADINNSIVSQYKAEIEAAQAVLGVFRLQVEIVQTRANVEKIKVDIYGTEVQAFLGSVNAFTAEVEGYKASVEAQGAIASAYKTTVDSYSAHIGAVEGQINSRIAVYKSKLEKYTASLQGYDSQVKAMLGQSQAGSEFNTAQAEVYKADVAAITSYNDTLTKQWQAVINEQELVAQIGVAAAKANGDLYIAARGLALDASKVGAQVTAQLGSAALGAISWHTNSNTSVNQSDSNNINFSTSTGTSTSFGTNFSTNTNTNTSTSTSTSTSDMTETIASI